MRRTLSTSLVAGAVALATSLAVGPQATAAPPANPGPPSFGWSETSIAQARQALVTGRITCTELVQGYLDRIEAFDDDLNVFISLNPDALAEAAALDAQRPNRGAKTPPLHCMPLVLKDNIDATGMPTTAGAAVLAQSTPPDDAFLAAELKEAGAIVLGKVNLDEFAFGFGGSSALGGQARNPYDLRFGPGGSSSGTGVAVSASLAIAGLGTDTGGSIRVPSSVTGLVGIRPSMRLLSQDGIVPLAPFQDTAGPMCRVVEDCAELLSVLVGFDGSEFSGQYTEAQQRTDTGVLLGSAAEYAAMVGVEPREYTRALKRDGLEGARIGVVRALFGSDPAVLAVLDQAIEAMRAAGATVEDVEIPELSTILSRYASVSTYEFKDSLTAYLQSWPSDVDGHPQTYEEVQAAATTRAGTFRSYATAGTDRLSNPLYLRNTEERPAFVRARLDAALENTTLDGEVLGEAYDALMYPSVQSLPRVGSPAAGSNNRLSPFSGYPALSMPAGFTPATADRVALPVGMELLGREFDEATLIRLAYGYQTAVEGTGLARQAPTTVPELVAAP